jgi:DinB superfamily
MTTSATAPLTPPAPSAPLAPLSMMLRINETLITRALEGLTDDQLWQRPSEHNNPMLWLFGHLVRSRARMLSALGEPFDTGWGDAFARGSAVEDRPQNVSGPGIVEMMASVSPRLYHKLESLHDQDIAQPASGPVPLIKTVADLATFLTMHESYHVGQLAYIRKSLGLPGLIG